MYIPFDSSLVHHLLTNNFLLISVVLWTGAFITWLRWLTDGQVDLRLFLQCKLRYFLFHFGKQYSSCLLVFMSLEKCFALYFPFKAGRVCTVRTARWATLITGVLYAGWNSQDLVFYTTRFSQSRGRRVCTFPGDWDKSLALVDSFLYSFGPFVVMSLTNIAIVIKFLNAKCKNIENNSTESTNQALSKAATRGTAMVVSVSVMFLLLTAPTAKDKIPVLYTDTPAYRAFKNIAQYLNHGINGVLYCVVGTKFRTELLNVFKCRSRLKIVQ